jgi:hypothetical protein
MGQAQGDRTVCPICGRGRLVDIAFDAGTGERDAGQGPRQRSDSSEVDVYDCGHEVPGTRLDRADRTLGVETRTSDEPVGDPTIDRERRHGLGESG